MTELYLERCIDGCGVVLRRLTLGLIHHLLEYLLSLARIILFFGYDALEFGLELIVESWNAQDVLQHSISASQLFHFKQHFFDNRLVYLGLLLADGGHLEARLFHRFALALDIQLEYAHFILTPGLQELHLSFEVLVYFFQFLSALDSISRFSLEDGLRVFDGIVLDTEHRDFRLQIHHFLAQYLQS